MDKDQRIVLGNLDQNTYDSIIEEVVTQISKRVHSKYAVINLTEIPDHVNYSKVEKYLRSVNIDITRKMFFSYLKENLVPSEQEVKNTNYSYYTKEQILYYILIDMFKPILPLGKVKILFHDILKPMIVERGLESTYKILCELIAFMVDRFNEAVTMAIKEKQLEATEIVIKTLQEIGDEKTMTLSYIANYTNLVTMCMAKGALDFYKYSPNTLLE